MRSLRSFLTDESGATAIEYSLIVAILFLGVSASIMLWGDSFKNLYIYLSTEISTAVQS